MKFTALALLSLIVTTPLYATDVFKKLGQNLDSAKLTILKIYPKMQGEVFHTLSYKQRKQNTQIAIRIDYDRHLISDDIVFSYRPLNKSPYPHAEVQPFEKFMLKFEPGHEIDQYRIRLSRWETKRILKEVARRTKRGSKRVYSRRNNLSEYLLRAISENIHDSFRDRSDDFIQNRFDNAYELEKKLRDIGVRLTHTNYRFKRAVDEFCAHLPDALNSCPKSELHLDDSLDSVLIAIDQYNKKVKRVFTQIKDENKAYINGHQISLLDHIARDFIVLDNALFRIQRDQQISTLAYRMNLMVELFRQVSSNYRYVRFFEEGAFDKSYGKFFLHDLYDNAKRWRKQVNSTLSKRLMKKVWKHFDSDFDRLGNSLGSGLVNFLGQIFKKRKYVPKLRWEANFRRNYLTKYRQRTLQELFNHDSMLPGDIILEKDLKANNDVIIPGYWLHASIYLGTIHDFKRMGVWELESFKNIRADIERYRSDKDWIEFLGKKLEVKMKFTDIPWFVESDRPGVEVHPIQKFLQTDGMVVLRPTSQDWNEQQVKRVFRRVNQRILFPYDYTHNVRNKFSVTCSKFILKVFDFIDFPVSKNLRYITHSPDQTGAAVSTSLENPRDGALEVIKFFDAYDEGKISYDRSNRATFHNYSRYLESIEEAY